MFFKPAIREFLSCKNFFFLFLFFLIILIPILFFSFPQATDFFAISFIDLKYYSRMDQVKFVEDSL